METVSLIFILCAPLCFLSCLAFAMDGKTNKDKIIATLCGCGTMLCVVASYVTFSYSDTSKIREAKILPEVVACADTSGKVKARDAWCSAEGWKHTRGGKYSHPYRDCVNDMIEAQRYECAKKLKKLPHE